MEAGLELGGQQLNAKGAGSIPGPQRPCSQLLTIVAANHRLG
jgi:hypothetical protein